MKVIKVIILYFLLFTSFTYSQEKYKGLIEYSLIKNTGSEEVIKEYLLLNETNSFYFTYNKNEDSFEKLSQNFEFKYSNNRLNFRNTNNEFFELRTLKNLYYTIDKSPKIEWKIGKEKKEILGYNCVKAEGFFRGRLYTVWFAPDIALGYGPWKLNGLPGLILEAVDNNNYFHYIATRISLNSEFAVPKVLQDKMSTETPITYKEFIRVEDDFFIDLRNKVKATYPKGTIFKEESSIRDLLKETSFEWDGKKEKLK